MRSSVTLLAPRLPKIRFGAHLGLHLDGYWGASWRQDGPRWRQVGQLGAKMCPRWPTWKPRWLTWRTFGSILATCFGSWARSCQKWRKPKKRREFITFEGFLGSWGCSWRLCWLILALCWAMLGHLGAILEQLGDKMRPESAKMIQDSAQERQDEARWRKWAPEGGSNPCAGTRRISMPPPLRDITR